MYIKLFTFFLFFVTKIALGQSYIERFNVLLKENDSIQITNLLKEWEINAPQDPEYYISAFNFYYSYCKQEEIYVKNQYEISNHIPQNDTIKIHYFCNNIDYFQLAINTIEKGIELFPNRLDFRFGKCYAFKEFELYKALTEELVKTINYSAINKNSWYWFENEMVDSSENFLLEAIQSYLVKLYSSDDEGLLNNMKLIGETAIKYYPNNIPIISSTAVAYMNSKDYEKSISYLKIAETLNPEDLIVINNLAHGYKLKGDKPNALKYYMISEFLSDEKSKISVQEEIQKLINE
jgi:tetratricopeptide (TPR) repeat protein